MIDITKEPVISEMISMEKGFNLTFNREEMGELLQGLFEKGIEAGRKEMLAKCIEMIDKLWQESIRNYDELGEDRTLAWGFGELKQALSRVK